jgi:hypothetical protein
MAEDIAGSPVSLVRWSRRSTYKLSEELKEKGIQVCPSSVGIILKDNDFSLKANRKCIAETHHPNRNWQFEIIAETRKRFEDAGQPIISVDSKKKELIGNFKNSGKTWRKNYDKVYDHDFRSHADGIAAPYGIFEPVFNLGTVFVGMSYDTAEFAVDCIEQWLNDFAQERYNNIEQLLILCDGGGSNGVRTRLWKYALYQQICKKYGICVRICHYPTGASKWNPVEHRLFGPITNNWQGRPLRSFEVAVECICSTSNKKGLKVDAVLNNKEYQKGIKVTDHQMKQINLVRHDELPLWNYSLVPRDRIQNAN